MNVAAAQSQFAFLVSLLVRVILWFAISDDLTMSRFVVALCIVTLDNWGMLYDDDHDGNEDGVSDDGDDDGDDGDDDDDDDDDDDGVIVLAASAAPLLPVGVLATASTGTASRRLTVAMIRGASLLGDDCPGLAAALAMCKAASFNVLDMKFISKCEDFFWGGGPVASCAYKRVWSSMWGGPHKARVLGPWTRGTTRV